MNAVIKNLFVDKIITLAFWLTVSSLLLYVLLLLLAYRNLPPLLPIFNQMPWGTPRVGTKIQLIIPFAIALGIVITNASLASYVYQRLPLVARMLALTMFFAGLLALLFLLRTLLIVLY